MKQTDMYVEKRDGRREPLDISKIQKQTKCATKDLEGVSQEELEIESRILFYPGIKTTEIQQLLIKTAVDKIDIDQPNWSFVAARLFLYDLYHRVTGKTSYDSLSKGMERLKKHEKLFAGLDKKFDLEYLDKFIKPERDNLFNYLGVKTLYDRYLLKSKDNKPIELPQHMFMAIAMFLAQNEDNREEWAIKFYTTLSQHEAMMATPTLSNARTLRHQLSSCFVGSTPDNIEGIFDSYKEMGILSKYGGGVGWDWNSVRAMGSVIDKTDGSAGGIVPFLKINNDTMIACNQLGVRLGAAAVYIEPWHKEITNFLDLKKNSGEDRRRTHELFPALWLNDLFMKRVEENADWTLFSPNETPELSELYGDEFEKAYEKYEKDDTIKKTVMNAKDLWKEILRSYFETGSPFLCWKDTANRANPNHHNGIIRSSNLCTEIFQNTQPSLYKVEVLLENGKKLYYSEDYLVAVTHGDDEKILKRAKDITSLDYIISEDNEKVLHVSLQPRGGNIAVCNLASLNLSKVNTKEKLEEVIPIVVRMLDNVIDLNYYPLLKAKLTNLDNRAIGLGVMGEAELLASRKIHWGSEEHYKFIDELFEIINYNTIKASSELAKEKGVYPEFERSDWSKGILPMDKHKCLKTNLVTGTTQYLDSDLDATEKKTRKLVYNSEQWEDLRERVRKGTRNGYMQAIAPTSTISILTGTSQGIEPVYKRKWYEENLSGHIPVVVPNLTPDTYPYYISCYDLDQRSLIRAGSIRQKWIDQGQSLNIFINLSKASGKYLNQIYTDAWKFGLKSVYYLRSQSPEQLQNDEGEKSFQCAGCQ